MISVLFTFVELWLISIIFLHFVCVTYDSCFEVSVEEEVNETCNKEERDLNQTTHVAQEL